MTGEHAVTLSQIEAAQRRLEGRIRRTPVERSRSLGEVTGQDVWLKLEHYQASGSFKFRGATNAVLQLETSEKEAGVVGVSTGNHGRGLARACAEAGVRCVVVMSSLVPENKVAAIRSEGAEVVISGRSQDEAQREVDRLVADGMTMIPPFDHPHVIAGQGTLGLEMIDDVPGIATAVVQVSGGGLISGVAAALKARKRGIRVIGVSMERGAAMHASLAAGRPVEVTEEPTLADSLGGGIGLENAWTFGMVRDLVDDLVLLTEDEIAAGIHHCYWNEGLIAEGSGAAGVAALLAGKVRADGPVVTPISGGNIDPALHFRIASGEAVDLKREVA